MKGSKGYTCARKQLNVIEGLCYVFWNGPENLEQAKIIIGDIYKFAHISSNCKNPHIDWRKDLLKLEKELKQAGLI